MLLVLFVIVYWLIPFFYVIVQLFNATKGENMPNNQENPLRPGAFKGPETNVPRVSLPRKDTLTIDSTPVDTAVGISEPLIPERVITAKGGIPDSVQQDKKPTSEDIKQKLRDLQLPRTAEEKRKDYLKGLKQAGITREQARIILDTLLFEGKYTKEYRITKKFKVTLGTRTYVDVQRALRYIESEAPTSPIHMDDLFSRYNLAASLVAYGDRKFDFPDSAKLNDDPMAVEDAFQIRFNFVMQLTTPMATRLNSCMIQFDTILNAVLSEGAPEDF